MTGIATAALAALALTAAPGPKAGFTLLYTGDNWGELAPCG